MSQVIKQVEERSVANEIDMLLWSDRMDLVAIANSKGEVALHRLSWARVWCLAPPYDYGTVVTDMAWRPDGRILAIAYYSSHSHIYLINVENKSILHKVVSAHAEKVTCISWAQEKSDLKQNEDDDPITYTKYPDHSSKYVLELSPLSSLSPTMTNLQDENTHSHLFHEQKDLNLLLIGTDEGHLRMSIFGQFVCADLHLSDYLGQKCSVMSAYLSNDLSTLHVTVKCESGVKIVVLKSDLLKIHSKEIFAIAIKDAHLNNLVSYLSNIIVLIKESWETSLLEMDHKLSYYASSVPDGVLSAEFLDLLMFGITSSRMQKFLLQDLTEKGLKKFGQVIEMCYANIQKLLLKHVTKAGQNITFHLSELRGMARLEHNFKEVGLSENAITEAIGANGSFLIKGGEMHQIINHFMINYKAFFRWIYSEIIHLMDEKVVPEMPKNTQQDVTHIMEFVLNFDHIMPYGRINAGKKNFTVEKLGQYLNDYPLCIPPETDENIWEQFLKRNECFNDDPHLIKHFPNYSLIMQFKQLVASIENIFAAPKSLLANHFSVSHIIDCLNIDDGKLLHLSEINNHSDSTFITFLNKTSLADGLYFLELFNGSSKVHGAYFYFNHFDNYHNYPVLDIKFYSQSILSVLLQDTNLNKNGILCQLNVSFLREKLVETDLNQDLGNQNLPKYNAFELGTPLQKIIDGMPCSYFAVSGCRRVSIVLSENRKRVRLYEMEAEEDDDEDADMTNSARESDTSMQEDSAVNE